MIKNLKEFKALIKRYETITIEEIEASEMDMEELTGFGYSETCTLCISANILMYKEGLYNDNKCNYCIWGETYERDESYLCLSGENEDTYQLIDKAKDCDQLLTAYRNRAKHMRSILKKLNIEMR